MTENTCFEVSIQKTNYVFLTNMIDIKEQRCMESTVNFTGENIDFFEICYTYILTNKLKSWRCKKRDYSKYMPVMRTLQRFLSRFTEETKIKKKLFSTY